jgi:hypothetical protein
MTDFLNQTNLYFDGMISRLSNFSSQSNDTEFLMDITNFTLSFYDYINSTALGFVSKPTDIRNYMLSVQDDLKQSLGNIYAALGSISLTTTTATTTTTTTSTSLSPLVWSQWLSWSTCEFSRYRRNLVTNQVVNETVFVSCSLISKFNNTKKNNGKNKSMFF